MEMRARLLAFDSSTEALGIGVDGPRGPVVWNGTGGAQASTALVPQLRALLAQQGLQFADLDAVAYGAGPGAFTGLRTACSVAQGLALGAGLPVVPIDSLMIVAEDVRLHVALSTHADVGVAMDARMGELYAARYRWDGVRWTTTMAPRLCRPEDLSQTWHGDSPSVLAGSGVAVAAPLLATARLQPLMIDRAMATLSLARRFYADGAGVDAALALPLYVRDKVAQTTAERLAVATGAVETAR